MVPQNKLGCYLPHQNFLPILIFPIKAIGENKSDLILAQLAPAILPKN
jgi:hypothetical protein